MSTSVKSINGTKYLYYSYYDKKTKKRKYVSCGSSKDPNAQKKAEGLERLRLENQSHELLTDLDSIQNKLNEFDSIKKKKITKKTTKKPSTKIQENSLDSLQILKNIKIAEPDIYYKSSINMQEVDDESVHLVITSPPYNVGKQYGKHDDKMDFQEYLVFLNKVWLECKRVLCTGGRIAINVADTWRQPYLPLHSFITKQMLDIGFLMRGVIYWDKGVSVGVSTAWGSWRSASNPTIRDVGEYILIFSKDDFKLQSDNRISTITSPEFTQYTKSLWSFPTVNAKKEKHPAPFPDELPSRLIKLYSFLGNVVLDPFLGSGTTCKMAKALGRKSIGYEIDKKYKPLIEKKIKNVVDVSVPLDCFTANGKYESLDQIYQLPTQLRNSSTKLSS